MESLLAAEAVVRIGAFASVLAIMLLWEAAAPRRRLTAPRSGRWLANLGVVGVDTVLVRLVFPAAAVGVALTAAERGFGLFNAVPVPDIVALVVSVVVLDLAVYGQHVAFHKVPALWRLHRMHHSDVDIDATTGIRFHPIEILLSMAYKMALVAILGAPAAAVVAFEVLLNATAMFNHGNVRLPVALDRALRTIVVTPDFHRVHHSIHRDETDSNYGFNLSIWDRLFRTYRPQPRDGHEAMTIGIRQFRTPRDRRLHRLLIQPFLKG
ncbi:MAG: sterol desaturase family protein [Rhodospirillales bacterium]|nr:sterol desaturase family protein [Rhodospirillales bacterium]